MTYPKVQTLSGFLSWSHYFEILKDDRQAAASVERAKQYLGRPYGVHFSPTDEALYCTELVHDSYLDADGQPIFHAAPMNFKDADGNFPLSCHPG